MRGRGITCPYYLCIGHFLLLFSLQSHVYALRHHEAHLLYDGIDVLAKVGGFEFGCLAGVILGAAANHAMTIIDGFNTTASAFIARALLPEVVNYLMASHLSLEQAHKKSLAALGLAEYIDLDFRLGESVGAGIQMKMLEIALAAFRECVTKEEAGVKA